MQRTPPPRDSGTHTPPRPRRSLPPTPSPHRSQRQGPPIPPPGPPSIGGTFSRHTPTGSPGGSSNSSSPSPGPPRGHGGGGLPGPPWGGAGGGFPGPPNPPAPPPGFPPIPPGFAMVPLAPDPKRKSHVQKPEDFTETKQWDKFKRQSFVYLEENRRDFPDGETVIWFLISFMTGGLPEKFAANFIDDLTNDL